MVQELIVIDIKKVYLVWVYGACPLKKGNLGVFVRLGDQLCYTED